MCTLLHKAGFAKYPDFSEVGQKFSKIFGNFGKVFPEIFFGKIFRKKFCRIFRIFLFSQNFPRNFPWKYPDFWGVNPVLQPGNIEKTGKKPRIFPPEFPGIPGEIPPGIFRETTGIRKETIWIFPRNLWRKHVFPKRILTKNPPVFRKSPRGIFGGFLTGCLTKKFPTFFRKTFRKNFLSEVFRKFPEISGKVSWQIFVKKFPTYFFFLKRTT